MTTGTGTGTTTATATAAVIGLNAGKRLLNSSYFYSDFPDRLGDWASVTSITVASSSRIVSLSPAKALRERPASFRYSFVEPAVAAAADHSSNHDLDAFLLLQKSMLETQWNLCIKPQERGSEDEILVIGSVLSARQRRISAKRKTLMKAACSKPSSRDWPRVAAASWQGLCEGRVERRLAHSSRSGAPLREN